MLADVGRTGKEEIDIGSSIETKIRLEAQIPQNLQSFIEFAINGECLGLLSLAEARSCSDLLTCLYRLL